MITTMKKVKKTEQAQEAASILGHRSAAARIRKWGKGEFIRRMREWGAKGGRPRKETGEQKTR